MVWYVFCSTEMKTVEFQLAVTYLKSILDIQAVVSHREWHRIQLNVICDGGLSWGLGQSQESVVSSGHEAKLELPCIICDRVADGGVWHTLQKCCFAPFHSEFRVLL